MKSSAFAQSGYKKDGKLADNDAIRELVLKLLTETHQRLTPLDLERTVRHIRPWCRRRDYRQAIRALVSSGDIAYTQHHATTHLELNFRRPVQVSERIVIAPETSTLLSDDARWVLKLQDGAAFGTGDHPTTRMMLCGLDYLTQPASSAMLPANRRVLDIGTGTGVLAIAAILLGAGQADAVDIDPAACHEANENAKRNKVQGQLQVFRDTPELMKRRYQLIMVNLRPPTVKEMIPLMMQLSSHPSIWLISGCRTNEGAQLKKHLPMGFSKIIWQEVLKGWSAFAVIRTSKSN